jgi:hypothetical protein
VSDRKDGIDDLNRLQRALYALAADLDAIERRPHPLRRHGTESGRSREIEGFVDKFAIAIERSRSGREL